MVYVVRGRLFNLRTVSCIPFCLHLARASSHVRIIGLLKKRQALVLPVQKTNGIKDKSLITSHIDGCSALVENLMVVSAVKSILE